MKIKAVKMKHFGKFTDKELEFGNGLNIIEGDNEAGKSTLHAFIRGMFFGIEKTRGRAGKNDIYSRYLPWDTPGAYQGSLDVEMGGRDIRISRVFLQNAKACSAQEIDTGKDIDLGEAGITALIDKLTPSAFDNTVSCAQQQLKSKEDFGSYIRSYIANMADSRDSRVDVSSALEVLDGKVRDITRKLKDTDEDAAQENLNSLLEDEKDESYIIADRDEARAAIADLEGKKNNVMRDIDPEALRIKHELAVRMAGKLKEADRDRAEAERYSERADDYRVRFTECENRLDARKEEFTRAAENLKDIKSELETASTGENDPETAAAAADDARIKAEESTAVLEELKTTQAGTAQKAKKLMLYGGLIAVLGLVAAVLFSERSKAGVIVGVVFALAGLIGLLFGCIGSRQAKRMHKDTDEAAEKAAKDIETADELAGRLDRIRAGITAIGEKLQKAESEYREAESGVKETTVERNGIVERKEELEADLKHITGNSEKIKREVIEELEKSDPDFAETVKTSADPAGDFEKIRSRLEGKIRSFEESTRELDTAINEKQKELAHIEGILLKYGDIGERIDEATKYLDEIRTRKSELTEELEAVKTAVSCIREISDDLKGSFDRKINELLGKNCELVTSGKYTKARITPDCEPEIMTDRGFIPVRSLSVGAAEQVFLAFRLAMAEFIFENEEIPLIFDEVFAYYDDSRIRSALEALSRLKGRQMILFACSRRERKILDELGADYKLITL